MIVAAPATWIHSRVSCRKIIASKLTITGVTIDIMVIYDAVETFNVWLRYVQVNARQIPFPSAKGKEARDVLQHEKIACFTSI